MTQEEKELLLKDLCVRLPYGIQIHIDFNENGHIVADATLNTIISITGQIFGFTDIEQDFKNGDCCPIGGFGSNKLLHLEEFKPYLRPLSSMTEEEKEYLRKNCRLYFDDCSDGITNGIYSSQFNRTIYEIVNESDISDIIDWLNTHHFDYRGLIEKGLALEAEEGMYKI